MTMAGEGSFQVDIRKSKTSKSGYQVLLRFSIGQHRRDEQLPLPSGLPLACSSIKQQRLLLNATRAEEGTG
jgi:hypothetical protein